MSRPLIIILFIVLVLAGALFLLSSQADEVATQTVEVDVTNEVGK